MKHWQILINICYILFYFNARQASAQVVTNGNFVQGKKIFLNNCAVCHDIDQEIVGPALVNITKKRRPEWLRNFIHSSQEVITGGDAYANDLFEQYNHTVMPDFRRLSEADISALLYYIDQVSLNGDPSSDDPTYPVQQTAILSGKLLFDNQCTMCHAIGKEMYGPALASVAKRHPYQWLFNFISNSQKVIHSGDLYAMYLFERYEGKKMPAFSYMKKEEIDQIIQYLRVVSEAPVHIEGVNGSTVPAQRNSLSAINFPGITQPDKLNGSPVPLTHEILKYVVLILLGFSLFLFVFLLAKFYKILQEKKG